MPCYFSYKLISFVQKKAHVPLRGWVKITKSTTYPNLSVSISGGMTGSIHYNDIVLPLLKSFFYLFREDNFIR